MNLSPTYIKIDRYTKRAGWLWPFCRLFQPPLDEEICIKIYNRKMFNFNAEIIVWIFLHYIILENQKYNI